jgi:SNF2 family DNA or RNA helicase
VLNSIEERIFNIIVKKQELFENYIETAPNVEDSRLSKELLEQVLEVPKLS